MFTPLLLSLLVFAVYLPSLKSGFAYDSNTEILDEGFVTHLSNLPAVLSLKVLGEKTVLAPRPGNIFYLMMIAAVCGTKPFGFHLCSNLLHAANAGLLFILLRRLQETTAENASPDSANFRKIAAAIATLLFALHPIAVEAVAEVSYSADLQVTFFTLLALLAATCFATGNLRRAWLAGGAGAVCAFASVTCKESGAVTFLLLALYWLLFRRREARAPWLLFLGASAAATLAFGAALVLSRPPDFQLRQHILYLGGSFHAVFLIQPKLWIFMIGKLFWPTRFSADYDLADLPLLSTPLAVLLLAGLVLLQGWLAAKSRVGALGAGIFWLALAPVSNLVPLFCVVADRFYYLPLVGVALQLVGAMGLIGERAAARFAWAALLVALVPLTILNVGRQAVFANELALWTDALRVCPDSAQAHGNLGAALLQLGRTPEAIPELRLALELKPQFPEAHNNLGVGLTQQGNFPAAIAEFRAALALDPGVPHGNDNLGMILVQSGRLEEAQAAFERAVQLDPASPEAYNDLGSIFFKRGDLDAAMENYRRCLKLDPRFASAHYNLGITLSAKGDIAAAAAEYRATLALEPDSAKANNQLGLALAGQGHPDQAIPLFRKAIAADPGYVLAHRNLGVVLVKTGDIPDAVAEFTAALQLEPNNPDAQKNLARAKALLSGRPPQK